MDWGVALEQLISKRRGQMVVFVCLCARHSRGKVNCLVLPKAFVLDEK